LTIAETTALVRRRELSAVALVEESLRQIDERQPELNAFITVMRDASIRDARSLDLRLARGETVGELAGVPFAVKDNIVTVDAPSSGGSSVYRSPPAAADPPLISLLRRADGILVGKTNMNEFGWGLDERIGPVANPVLPGRSAGGSSGGSAASVAAGVVAFAIGTDGGGSIRMPAAFCGLVGLKPTHLSISQAGLLASSPTLTDAGPITTNIADCVAVAQVLLQRRDTIPAPGNARLGVIDGSLETCKAIVREALESAIDCLHGSARVELDTAEALHAWQRIFFAETTAELLPTIGNLLPQMSSDLRRLVAEGETVSRDDYGEALAQADELGRRVDDALEHYDALLAPTVPSPPPRDEPAWDDDDFLGDIRWTVLTNLTGHPSVTLPVEATEPVGVQLIGRRGADTALLGLAEQLDLKIRAANRDGRRLPHA
jgi:aspartyl-tRNA(Asn)/glutamyl-tRNA(Gln) amidotransferase subunit A